MMRALAVASLAACILAGLSGCGRTPATSGLAGVSSAPGPGQMKVVSVEPLKPAVPAVAPDPGNLLAGGNFAGWWPGAVAPKGFAAPDNKFSSLAKISREGAPNVVEQKWAKADAGVKYDGLFRAEVPSTPGNSDYVLEVGVSGYVHVDVWESAESGKPVLVQQDLIVTPPGPMAAKRYVKSFKTNAGGTLVIAARSTCDPPDPRGVQWYNWRLTRSGGK